MDHLRENIAAFIDSYYNRADVAGSEFEFFRHEEIFRSDVGSKTEGEPARNRLPRPSSRLVSGWLFLGGLLSSIARFRFANRGPLWRRTAGLS